MNFKNFILIACSAISFVGCNENSNSENSNQGDSTLQETNYYTQTSTESDLDSTDTTIISNQFIDFSDGDTLHFELGKDTYYRYKDGVNNEYCSILDVEPPAKGIEFQIEDGYCLIFGKIDKPIYKNIDILVGTSADTISLNLNIEGSSEDSYFQKFDNLIRYFVDIEMPILVIENYGNESIIDCTAKLLPIGMEIVATSRGCELSGLPNKTATSAIYQIIAVGENTTKIIELNLEVVVQIPMIITLDTSIRWGGDSTLVEIWTRPFFVQRPEYDYLYEGYEYNFNIDWGDGNKSVGLKEAASHSYETHGIYQVTITGYHPSLAFRPKLIAVNQWGNQQWKSIVRMFDSYKQPSLYSVDVPDLTYVKSLAYLFQYSQIFEGDLSQWDVSGIEQMHGMLEFSKLTTENYDALLENWSQLDLQQNVELNLGESQYSQSAQQFRDILTVHFNWIIIDDGIDPSTIQ